MQKEFSNRRPSLERRIQKLEESLLPGVNKSRESLKESKNKYLAFELKGERDLFDKVFSKIKRVLASKMFINWNGNYTIPLKDLPIVNKIVKENGLVVVPLEYTETKSQAMGSPSGDSYEDATFWLPNASEREEIKKVFKREIYFDYSKESPGFRYRLISCSPKSIGKIVNYAKKRGYEINVYVGYSKENEIN